MTAARFGQFIAIDWSGARGERHKGIAIASCRLDGGAPVLLKRESGWSRADVLAMLRSDLADDTLVGLDLGIALPFVDAGAYFPGWPDSPPDCRRLWALVDDLCAGDLHLGADGVVDHPALSAYFRRHGGREGNRFHLAGAHHLRGRLRLTELWQERQGCKPYSNFNLVGAAQVGKASLTGMRVLHRLQGCAAVWPVDPLPSSGPVITEIYTALAAIAAGRTAARSKITDGDMLDHALATLGSRQIGQRGAIDDHSADALITAAWLRTVAHDETLWHPPALTEKIAATEGWTFGVR
ncbi:hypothetical protein RM533_02075 [Croceicoccus sp. F390]|uniref:DUF429 domain-containing protein n=1 Tax=Croceicoccus esteveae TaxID=3075597 RepID=A0ABU2ZHS7_9SPHN|nr:hypothetical protein [Croceicoccus sp. F390]MDT0574967.1 hypothetical protein [Croceicoccus sp. F390]